MTAVLFTTMYAIVKYQGKIFRISRQPFETNEQVLDRAWYIATNYQEHVPYSQLENRSLQWMYEKYLGCK